VGVLDVEVPSQLSLSLDGPLLPLLMLQLLIVETHIHTYEVGDKWMCTDTYTQLERQREHSLIKVAKCPPSRVSEGGLRRTMRTKKLSNAFEFF
jgi:hypothetical protein